MLPSWEALESAVNSMKGFGGRTHEPFYDEITLIEPHLVSIFLFLTNSQSLSVISSTDARATTSDKIVTDAEE